MIGGITNVWADTHPPHGYERLTLSANNVQFKSTYFIEESANFVYDHYANLLKLSGVPSEDVTVNDKRLIDIEIDVTGEKPKQEFRFRESGSRTADTSSKNPGYNSMSPTVIYLASRSRKTSFL